MRNVFLQHNVDDHVEACGEADATVDIVHFEGVSYQMESFCHFIFSWDHLTFLFINEADRRAICLAISFTSSSSAPRLRIKAQKHSDRAAAAIGIGTLFLSKHSVRISWVFFRSSSKSSYFIYRPLWSVPTFIIALDVVVWVIIVCCLCTACWLFPLVTYTAIDTIPLL